jgi:hypothetical protein
MELGHGWERSRDWTWKGEDGLTAWRGENIERVGKGVIYSASILWWEWIDVEANC